MSAKSERPLVSVKIINLDSRAYYCQQKYHIDSVNRYSGKTGLANPGLGKYSIAWNEFWAVADRKLPISFVRHLHLLQIRYEASLLVTYRLISWAFGSLRHIDTLGFSGACDP